MKDANNKRSSVPESTVDSVVINKQLFLITGFYQIDTDKFHKNKFINYQLNRWHSLGYAQKEGI